LHRCLDAAPWEEATDGLWALHRCLGRLGLPLTPVAGFRTTDAAVEILSVLLHMNIIFSGI
jgi:hypothetical protein